ALDPQEWFTHRIRSLSETAESLVPALPRRQSPNEGYLTVAGDQAILDRMKTMVENARLRIYLSLPAAWLTPLVSALRSACSRGIRLTVLCDATLAPSFAGLPEVVIHPTVPPGGQIRLIVDSSEVLTGDGESGTPSCLYSRRPALVALFKQALGNEIRLLELGEAKTLD
ncbi:MAG TPA: TrmB family transcriptional regulator sugar-binding domain-containing protein, partial [Spirochaetia bacterium]|nr:TrmB family transcriptional regulator sugar-binding domain-containing protein [Spirochaetia bacterium]